MNVLAPGALPPLETLRSQWRSASLASTWLHPDDWYHPSIDVLLEALPRTDHAESACEALGSARAEAGCGVGETIDDLTCLFGTLNRPAPGAAIRALTIGWVGSQTATSLSMSCVDASSGLHTLEYFSVRLREVYGALARGRVVPSAGHSLLFVDVGLENLSLLDSAGCSAGMGHALLNAFEAGHPIAVLGGCFYVTLVEPPTDLAPSADADALSLSLSKRIEQSASDLGFIEFLRRPPRVWCEPLPDTHEDVMALLHGRRRR